MNANQSPLLTTAQAAALLGIKSRTTVWRWIAQGVIPADVVVWSGRRPRIQSAWLRQQQTKQQVAG